MNEMVGMKEKGPPVAGGPFSFIPGVGLVRVCSPRLSFTAGIPARVLRREGHLTRERRLYRFQMICFVRWLEIASGWI